MHTLDSAAVFGKISGKTERLVSNRMKELILVKVGELALKGLNKNTL